MFFPSLPSTFLFPRISALFEIDTTVCDVFWVTLHYTAATVHIFYTQSKIIYSTSAAHVCPQKFFYSSLRHQVCP